MRKFLEMCLSGFLFDGLIGIVFVSATVVEENLNGSLDLFRFYDHKGIPLE